MSFLSCLQTFSLSLAFLLAHFDEANCYVGQGSWQGIERSFLLTASETEAFSPTTSEVLNPANTHKSDFGSGSLRSQAIR